MLIIAQIVISIILIILILLQERSSGMSGIFGVSTGGTPYQTRRGLEKIIYWATIVASALFAGLAVASLIIR